MVTTSCNSQQQWKVVAQGGEWRFRRGEGEGEGYEFHILFLEKGYGFGFGYEILRGAREDDPQPQFSVISGRPREILSRKGLALGVGQICVACLSSSIHHRNHWFADAPEEDAILQAISILWTIWCNRNRAALDRSVLTPEEEAAAVDHILLHLVKQLLGIILAWRFIFCLLLKELGMPPSVKGVAAWACALLLDLCNSCGSTTLFAHSAAEVEAKACYEALLWALHHGHWNVKLSTDCLEVIQGRRNCSRVNPLLAGLLGDILHLCTFFNVVMRDHNIARAALQRFL
ncbi:hypothetical protein Acr_00g0049390 [Actinidia rufa]|uniref:RNase H type-1 domain-containing protein n=1 Tax=Actinidia rufa TaxID=165716 RepID=A0A7J0DK96_9ERIC|nr:hypothetical protein Acr_00g0049390 [Actinidia rufa]